MHEEWSQHFGSAPVTVPRWVAVAVTMDRAARPDQADAAKVLHIAARGAPSLLAQDAPLFAGDAVDPERAARSPHGERLQVMHDSRTYRLGNPIGRFPRRGRSSLACMFTCRRPILRYPLA